MPAPSARAALSATLLDFRPESVNASRASAADPAAVLLCCKGEASPEGFRPAHRGLRAALAHAAPRVVAEAPRKTPSARIWLRVDG